MAETHQRQEKPGRWPRRRFLKWGIGGGVVTALGFYRAGCYDTDWYEGLNVLSARAAVVLAAAVETMVPPWAPRDAASIMQHVRAIDSYLVGLPTNDQQQVQLLLHALEHATLISWPHFQRFTRLSPARRASYLYGWQTSRFQTFRLGLQSLKTMVFLAYYQDDDAFRPIGYSGPIARNFEGPPASKARYDALLAPRGAFPGAS